MTRWEDRYDVGAPSSRPVVSNLAPKSVSVSIAASDHVDRSGVELLADHDAIPVVVAKEAFQCFLLATSPTTPPGASRTPSRTPR